MFDADTVTFNRGGLINRLIRAAEPTVLDISKDSLVYFMGARKVTLGGIALQEVDTITFDNGGVRYRVVP